MAGNKSKSALLRLKQIEKKDAVFEVVAIVNLQGYKTGDSLSVSSFGEDSVFIKDFFKTKEFESFFDLIKRKEIVEAQINILESSKFQNRKSFEIDKVYGIKRVKYLFDAQWIDQKNNQFYSPERNILTFLNNRKLIIPLDLKAKRIFDTITIINDAIFPEDKKSSELKYYSFEIDDRLIPISQQGQEYCMTEKAFRKIEKQEEGAVELLSYDSLKEWLKSSLKYSSDDEKKQIDEIVNSLAPISEESRSLYKMRLKRCKKVFVEPFLSQEDVRSFLNQSSWKETFESEKKAFKEEIFDKIEKSVNNEKEKMLLEVRKEVGEYKDNEIERKRAEQVVALNEILERIKQGEQKLSELSLDFVRKNSEIEIAEEKLQSIKKKISLMKEEQIDILSELEKSKTSILKSLMEGLDISKPCSSHNEINNEEEFFPVGQNSRDLDEDDDLYKVISTDWNMDLKEKLVSVCECTASMLPNVSYAYAIAHFIGNCHLKIITVEHGWYHYEDFIRAGLVDFWNRALSNPEENYLLVLQNINMIPIQSSLQPLVDLINGSRLSLPGSNRNEYPVNLRIAATILPTNGENAPGLPLDRKCYGKFYFVGSPEDTLPESISEIMMIPPKKHVKLSNVKIEEMWDFDNDRFEKYSDY